MKIQKKKSLGQNFLKSKSVVSAILDASDPTLNEIILEIGPGEGFMTEELVKFGGKIIVVEKDHRLIPILEEKFKKQINEEKLNVLEKDVLDFDISTLKFYKLPYKVIANIPYYITGQILRKFLESDFKPISMTLLVQKEVAERMVTKDKKESLLSLSVKVYGEPKIIKKVSKNLFSPVPKVDSAVIIIENISDKNFKNITPEFFFKVIHSGFKHKRKQIFANLFSDFDKQKVTETLQILNIDKKSRAEDLSLDDWISISEKLNAK